MRLFLVALLVTACGPRTSMLPSIIDPADAGITVPVDGGVTCTLELETQMTAALTAVATTESFVVELRRNSDDRVFRMSRAVPGKTTITERSTLQSASTAKLISATIILDVIANPSSYPGGGRVNGVALTLDSPVRDFLPAWNPPATSRLSSATLRHLLSFTSGLEREHACISSLTAPDTCVTNLVDANLMVNRDANEPRTFFYSGSHLFVAAQLAVRASGLGDWGALFKRFKEQHGVFQTPLESAGPASFGVGAFFPTSGPGNSPSPAGALRYTAGDYPPFLQKLMRAQVLPKPMLDELLSDQVSRLGATIEYSPVSDTGEDWRYGLGNWSECNAPAWSSACAAARRFSSPGSFGTYPFIDFNPSAGGEAPYVGLLGYGGTAQGQSPTTIAIYRSLQVVLVDGKDLAQRWAASTCL